jgi:RNA recognition motif-containing protein
MPIYVGHLSNEVTQDDLIQLFEEYGTVKSVYVPTNKETGQPRGSAFVEMETDTQESTAIEALNGSKLMGRNIKVSKAKPPTHGDSSKGEQKKKQ